MSTCPCDRKIDCDQEIDIAAPPDVSFQTLLRQLGEHFGTPEDNGLSMKLEAFPGGRWYRDLGDNQGHLWGHVQVIKPPTLLEIYGPMFMSYPVVSHMQFRLAQTDSGTRLSLRHQAFGMIDESHSEGVSHGWAHLLKQVRDRTESS